MKEFDSIPTIAGIYEYYESHITPEARLAQDLQDLKDLAAWRARHMPKIKEWSKEENIKKRVEKLQEESSLALARGLAMSKLAKEAILAKQNEQGRVQEPPKALV